jgi:hypothetical protein
MMVGKILHRDLDVAKATGLAVFKASWSKISWSGPS